MALAFLTPAAFFNVVATVAGSNTLLPVTAGQTTVYIVNIGSAPAMVLLSASAGTAPPTQSTGTAIMPGQALALALGSNTYIAVSSAGFGNAILNGTIGT